MTRKTKIALNFFTRKKKQEIKKLVEVSWAGFLIVCMLAAVIFGPSLIVVLGTKWPPEIAFKFYFAHIFPIILFTGIIVAGITVLLLVVESYFKESWKDAVYEANKQLSKEEEC